MNDGNPVGKRPWTSRPVLTVAMPVANWLLGKAAKALGSADDPSALWPLSTVGIDFRRRCVDSTRSANWCSNGTGRWAS